MKSGYVCALMAAGFGAYASFGAEDTSEVSRVDKRVEYRDCPKCDKRIRGFKVQVVEFVSSEATARNILLRCEYGVKAGQPGPVGEYLELRDYWKVVPWLETRLEKQLSAHLSRYAEGR